MRMIILLMVGCVTLLISSTSFAYCSTCRTFESSTAQGSCGYLSCRLGYRCPAAMDCDCTDPYCTSVDNTCQTCSSCCDAFGNVGAR